MMVIIFQILIVMMMVVVVWYFSFDGDHDDIKCFQYEDLIY